MIGKFISLLVLFTALVTSVQAVETSPPAPKVDRNPLSSVDTLVLSNNELGFELYMLLKKRDENLIFSPYNLATALQMLYMGAAGLTQSQMARILHFRLPPKDLAQAAASLASTLVTRRYADKDELSLSIANSLWIQSGYPILPNFKDTITNSFKGSVKSVNFKTMLENVRKEINDWVKGQTQGKIVDLLEPGHISESTRLLLVSALYMHGKWLSTFDPSLTKLEPFFPEPSKTLTLPTMHMTAHFPFLRETNFAMIELAYASQPTDPKLSLFIILPHENFDLEVVESNLNSQKLIELTKRLKSTNLILSIPKFKVTSTLGLKSSLERLGLTDPFSSSANFSEIDGTQNLAVSDVVQKGFLTIDEKGTEAGVATAVSIGLKSIPTQPAVTFNIDSPFLFFIAEKETGTILFLGRIVSP